MAAPDSEQPAEYEVMLEEAQLTTFEKTAPYTAEFFGTFVLVFTAACLELSLSAGAWGSTAMACTLMVLVYSTAATSGGNLNPAVSLALGCLQALPWTTVLGYSVTQVVAGVAAGCCAAVFNWPQLAVIGPVAPHHWLGAVLAELAYTAILCFVFCNCMVSSRNNPRENTNQFYGLAIGFVMVAAGNAAGGISGARLNPAVVLGLGPVSESATHYASWALVWILIQLAGSLVAALLFKLFRAEEGRLSGRALSDFKSPLNVRCLSELLGTFVLVLTIGLTKLHASEQTPWAAAASLMCMIYALGNVSGGHFNPAVTLAVVASDRGKCSFDDGAMYIVFQALGGVLGGYAGGLAAASPHPGSASLGPDLAPGPGHSMAEAGFAELVFTCLLAYCVLACATVAAFRNKENFYFALAIGSCITAGGFAAGPISGGELNPAVSLGMCVFSSTRQSGQAASCFHTFFVFMLWEFVGGLLAAAVFCATHQEEFDKRRQQEALRQQRDASASFAQGSAAVLGGA
eukprot:TRINITY_DN22771_c0_g1_i3.p1 TRINITY_DN22771_c0_g1~~TRINITY_DN22771_c0_g1_i3.p1  ORF type:complete len:517 (-),score=96.60 TRINITY_DN22771_c0_g1_i3:847-2397(-)